MIYNILASTFAISTFMTFGSALLLIAPDLDFNFVVFVCRNITLWWIRSKYIYHNLVDLNPLNSMIVFPLIYVNSYWSIPYNDIYRDVWHTGIHVCHCHRQVTRQEKLWSFGVTPVYSTHLRLIEISSFHCFLRADVMDKL